MWKAPDSTAPASMTDADRPTNPSRLMWWRGFRSGGCCLKPLLRFDATGEDPDLAAPLFEHRLEHAAETIQERLRDDQRSTGALPERGRAGHLPDLVGGDL